MILNLILTILCGSAGVILMEKWKVDNFMNTDPFWSVIWPEKPCMLCRGFWIGCMVFTLLCLIPNTIYFFVPLAAIPMQLAFWQIAKSLLK
ncbi:hypothetical protein [Larkinella harenae]